MTKTSLITSNLINHIIEEIEDSSSIHILSSFVMSSGVQLLKKSLRNAAERGAEIKVLTGDYLYITQPEALLNLFSIHPNIEIRLWKSNGVSFHPKVYIFHSIEEGTIIIGSSNLSHSALTNGIEWNLKIGESILEENYQNATEEYTKMFYSEQTIPINVETIKLYQEQYELYQQRHSNLANVWTESEEVQLMFPDEEPNQNNSIIVNETIENYETIIPRFAQLEALRELENAFEEEYSSALVVMATGLGKTYLAGFFSERFKRVLFIAHREEILHQAQRSFQSILPDRTYGIYNGKQKVGEADVVFASIFTLSMKRHLEFFDKNDFNLIIVDEFHHAAARSYKNVLDYFTPEFLLGITATPDRNDNKDVYAICDGNVAYRIDFLEAIQRQWLAPFKYYGIYDETDYSKITWLGNRYSEEELLHIQLKEELAEKIYQAWIKHKQTRTLAFCSSIKQADFLSNYFNNKGIKTISLHSNQKVVSRPRVIHMLETREIEIIFTVDLFNEGVDIPSVDTLLFVRPTESLTIFTQQIGRGLRLHQGKSHCVIIDLIGNYRNADIKLSLFDTNEAGNKKVVNMFPAVPDTCEINLDIAVIDLLKEMSRKRQPRKEKLLNDYLLLKQELGRRPTYLELHLMGKANSVEYRQEFKSYFTFLQWADELSEKEVQVYKDFEHWLLEIEKTDMTKSYKMVVLKAMLSRGINDWYKPITPEEVAPFFHQYLTEKEYRKRIDFSDIGSSQLHEYNQQKVSKLIAKMPMTKWSGSSNGLVVFTGNQFYFDIHPIDNEILYNWTNEICEYRLHYHFERKSRQ